jgi:ABC-type dipeptide/oligopeptide/nickel transport system permease component
MALFIGRRLLLLPLQAAGVVTIVFVLVHLLPGDPAALMAGPMATADQIARIRADLGLTQPLLLQYVRYLERLLHGDLGTSWYTSNPVATDIAQRAPATLELITLALVGIICLGLLIAGVIAVGPRGTAGRLVTGYGFVAGALPDFWVGLALIFVVYSMAHLGPSPTGQLGSHFAVPTVTGIPTVDAFLAGDPAAFADAMKHLVLPVITLVFVYMGPVVRITGVAAVRSLNSEFSRFAQSWGIAPWRRQYYALRHVMPTFVIAVASAYGYLLGGAVLVETVFSWGGFGQYAVQAVTHSDYAAIEGFVIVAGIFTVLVYTVADVLQMALDPRTRR